MVHAGHTLLHDLKENVVTAYVIVESLGWFYGLQIIGKTASPALYRRLMSLVQRLFVPSIATSLTVPGWLKSGWRRQKWVLREAAADLVPASIRHRKKAIQRLDVHGAMGEVLSDLAGDWLVDSALEKHRLLTGTQLQQVRSDRTRARESREVAHRLWAVLSLECWARRFLEAPRHGLIPPPVTART